METRNHEIAADVPVPEELEGMSSDQLQGCITEKACFTVSPGARQVRQRKEVTMSQLTPEETPEFFKSMDTEWQTLLKNQAAKVLSSSSTLARSCDGLVGSVPGSQTTAIWTSAKARLIMKGSQILTSSTLNLILRRLPGRF